MGRIRLMVHGRLDKVPGPRQAVNDSPKTALSSGVGEIGLRSVRCNAEILAWISYNR